MAQERLSLGANPVDGDTDGNTHGGAETRTASTDGGEDGVKTPRLPRWTRQEILVLMQGKRVAENRVSRGRAAGMAFGSGLVEPKWTSVSSYCKRHGVNREPVQCRKRWSNLASDFKKIKEWESQIKDDAESFWVMRNDLRKERKLPGIFDKEVYDILDGGVNPAGSGEPALALALSPASTTAEPAEELEVMFGGGRRAVAEEGLFSDFEQDEAAGSPAKEAAQPVAAPVPISVSEKQYESGSGAGQGTTNEKQPMPNPETRSTSQEQRKRRRMTTDEEEETNSQEHQLIDILERNGKMLAAQLEAHNSNFQLDREQRKDRADSLVTVLNKLADALGRIADKL